MQTDTLKGRAVAAAGRFLSRRGHEILSSDFFGEGDVLDLVTREGDAVVFVGVNVDGPDGYFHSCMRKRRCEVEREAARFLAQRAPEGDVPVRFDEISILVVADDKALLRHEDNCLV